MSDHNFGIVKCCDRNSGYIRFNWSYNLFYIDLDDVDGVAVLDSVEYCPWCGILLDTNLLEDG